MNLARAADRRARVLVGARAPFRAPADSVDYAPLAGARGGAAVLRLGSQTPARHWAVGPLITSALTTSPRLGKVVLRRHFGSGASRTRTGDLLGAMRGCDCASEAAFLALESGTGAPWIPPRQGTDSPGLPGITFDLGTRGGPVPIHLAGSACASASCGSDTCFSREAGGGGP